MKTWKELLKSGIICLEENQIDDAVFEATQLLLTFFDGKYEAYLMNSSLNVSESDSLTYNELIKRRIDGVPLQYILGKWDFYEDSFFVGKGVLIPRPETEELVERCIRIIRENNYNVIYDLCTGSGCIGISIARACPDVQCFLFELYDDAIYYAEKNISALNASGVKLIKHNVLDAFNEDIPVADMIISNPPYIESAEIATLQSEVLEEPVTALDGGDDGLIFYKAFFEKWSDRLKTSGYFAFECGENQTALIASLAGDAYYTETFKDMYDNNRFVFAKKK